MNTETIQPINYSVYNNEVRRNDTPKHVYTSNGLSVNSRAKDESEFIQYLNEKENHEETEPETEPEPEPDTNIYNDEFEDSLKHEPNELEKLENNSHANMNELQDFEEEFYKTDQPADANYISDEFEINLTKKQIRERRRPVNQIKELSSDVTSLKNNEVQEAEQQQIREKRKPINQQLQELSSSSNDALKNPDFKKHNPSHNFKIIAILVLTFALFYFQQFGGINPSFFQKFLTNKNNTFERMNNLYITAGHLDKLRINLKDEEDKLTDVTYELCNEDGNVIEIDLKYLNPRITTGLHNCGEKLMVVGKNLQSTYSKGLEVYKKFDMEIEAIMSRLNSTDDDEYFKERLNELTAMTEEFRELVEKTQSSIQYAGYIRNDTEGYIHDGLKEVEKLIAKNYTYCNSDDDAKAKKEREVVDNILNHLNSTTGHLNMTEQILKEYGYKLMGVAAELEGAGKGDDNSFDLKYLKLAVNTLF